MHYDTDHDVEWVEVDFRLRLLTPPPLPEPVCLFVWIWLGASNSIWSRVWIGTYASGSYEESRKELLRGSRGLEWEVWLPPYLTIHHMHVLAENLSCSSQKRKVQRRKTMAPRLMVGAQQGFSNRHQRGVGAAKKKPSFNIILIQLLECTRQAVGLYSLVFCVGKGVLFYLVRGV